jgi:predicted P-loop ATPase
MNRGDIESWKAFITRRSERYRPFYGRRETIEPRQCSFAGSTNKEEYLHDETGNRRFWPLLTGTIDLDALKGDREQLFAEAVQCYRNKEPWWPTREFEQEHIVPEQEARFEEDAWQPLIADWLEKLPNGPDRDRVLVHEVALHACSVTHDRLGTTEARRIRRVLHRLGWRQAHRIAEGRFYYRPGHLPEDDA